MKKLVKPYKKCVEAAKQIAKERDNFQCRKCGKTKDQCQIHASHILGTGAHPRLAPYPLNIKALCSHCHRNWHSSPVESGEWFRSKFPDWWKELEALRKKVEGDLTKPNYEKMYNELKK